ncbi:MAG: VTT domain-containing protein [Acidobacteriaceae bacterium]
MLAHLGPWGVFVAAITDNLLPVIPVDAVVASYVYREPRRMWFYVILATTGAMLGSLVWFFIGRAGGELLLLKRINRAKLESLQARYRKQEFFFIAIPCMLPPPTPLKLIILAAGAFGMSTWMYVVSTLAGRFARFLILSLLVVHFGPQIVGIIMGTAKRHGVALLAAICAAIVLTVVWKKIARKRRRTASVKPK